jgi:uncharacterized protein (TIGR03437 family)
VAWAACAALLCGQGIIITIAGTGVAGFNGDDQPAREARLNFDLGDPNEDQEDIIHVWVDASGNVYIPDRGNNRIRRVGTNGGITTVAGNGQHSFSGDGEPATAAALDWPASVTGDAAGNLYIADQHNNRIRRVDRAGVITTYAGNGRHSFSGNGGPARDAALDYPAGLALDAAGNLYISDQHNSQVRRVRPNGVIEAFAGDGRATYAGDGGAAVRASLDWPTGLALDAAGNVYIADQFNNRIRRVAPDGVITTFAGDGRATFAGDGGPAGRASLNHPADVAVDAAGNLYIADQRNHRIRRVSPEGIITTVAGAGAPGFSGDGGPAALAALNRPSGVTVDAEGNLYIADHSNFRVRKVTFPKPAAGGVTNAASFATGPIAPGEIISIFGVNLGPATGAGAELDPATGRLATTRAGVTVLFNDVPGPLFFVRQDQINVQVPYELAGQTSARIVARYLDAAGAPATAPVAPAAPGIFAVSRGTGQAAMLNQDSTVNSASNPAARGSIVQIYLTGQGATQPPAVTGQLAREPFPAPVLPVTVTIGGRAARTLFVGLAPGLAGLLQINAVVPDDAPPGDAVPLVVSVGQASSQPGVTMAVR